MSSSFWMILQKERKSYFWVTRSWQQAEFLAPPHGLGAARGPELVEGAGAVGLHGVLGDEELSCDLAIAEAAGDEGEDFELTVGDAEALLLSRVWTERRRRLGAAARGRAEDFFRHRIPPARDAQAEPDAEGGEEDGHERAVELDRVLDDDETVFGVLKDGDEQAADKTEDKDGALHEFDSDVGSHTKFLTVPFISVCANCTYIQPRIATIFTAAVCQPPVVLAARMASGVSCLEVLLRIKEICTSGKCNLLHGKPTDCICPACPRTLSAVARVAPSGENHLPNALSSPVSATGTALAVLWQ